MKKVKYIPKLNPDGSRFIDPVTNDYVNILIEVEDDGVDLVIPPQWTSMKEDLFGTALFNKALTEANPNVYSTLLKVIQDGENNVGKEENFKAMFNLLGVNWTSEEISEINNVLAKNHFTIIL